MWCTVGQTGKLGWCFCPADMAASTSSSLSLPSTTTSVNGDELHPIGDWSTYVTCSLWKEASLIWGIWVGIRSPSFVYIFFNELLQCFLLKVNLSSITVPKYLCSWTSSTICPPVMSGATSVLSLLKPTTISFVFPTLSSRTFWVHQSENSLTLASKTLSDSDMSTIVGLSENSIVFCLSYVLVQSFV